MQLEQKCFICGSKVLKIDNPRHFAQGNLRVWDAKHNLYATRFRLNEVRNGT